MQGKRVKFFSFENIHSFRFIHFVTMGNRLFFSRWGPAFSIKFSKLKRQWKSPPLSVQRVGDGLEGGRTKQLENPDHLQQNPSRSCLVIRAADPWAVLPASQTGLWRVSCPGMCVTAAPQGVLMGTEADQSASSGTGPEVARGRAALSRPAGRPTVPDPGASQN